MKAGATHAFSALKPEPDAQPTSAQKLQFFESQHKALHDMSLKNSVLVVDRKAHLEPLLATKPQLAIDAMSAIGRSFELALPQAMEHQKQATAAEWLALRGRMSFGTEQLRDTKETVTKLDKLRTADKSSAGLLELILDTDHGSARVVSANARGVSQATAETLRGVDLSSARVPLRLVVGWNVPNPAIIVKDEVGRIRVSGGLEHLARFDVDGAPITTEVQAERAARIVLEIAMSRPLGGWGAQIGTDDQSAKE